MQDTIQNDPLVERREHERSGEDKAERSCRGAGEEGREQEMMVT